MKKKSKKKTSFLNYVIVNPADADSKKVKYRPTMTDDEKQDAFVTVNYMTQCDDNLKSIDDFRFSWIRRDENYLYYRLELWNGPDKVFDIWYPSVQITGIDWNNLGYPYPSRRICVSLAELLDPIIAEYERNREYPNEIIYNVHDDLIYMGSMDHGDHVEPDRLEIVAAKKRWLEAQQNDK